MDEPTASLDPSTRREVRETIRRGGKVLGLRLPAAEKRYDIGNFESYYAAFVEFALADPKYGAKLREQLKALLRVASD